MKNAIKIVSLKPHTLNQHFSSIKIHSRTAKIPYNVQLSTFSSNTKRILTFSRFTTKIPKSLRNI